MILGIDIGSRSIEVVGLSGGEVVEQRRAPTTFNPVAQVLGLLHGLKARRAVATGYGRKLVQDLDLGFPVEAITEIKAHGLGAYMKPRSVEKGHEFPEPIPFHTYQVRNGDP